MDADAPFQMLVTTLGYDDYRGVTALGRITAGRIIAGQPLARLTTDGQNLPERARYLYVHQGLQRVEVKKPAPARSSPWPGWRASASVKRWPIRKIRSHCRPSMSKNRPCA